MTNGRLTLKTSREVCLVSLRQWNVYAGLLEGLPTRKMNDATIERVRREARERVGHDPFVVEPTQTPIDHAGRYPFGEPASLPRIACVGDFVSTGRDPTFETTLTVIWFQDEFAFPLDAEVASALAELDWDALAHEHEL
jgi:hypothetical protein